MKKGDRLAAAAATFLGVPFALHGRNPDTGLDCVGLLLASLQAIGVQTDHPIGYGLRNATIARWLACAPRSGLYDVSGPVVVGDVLLTSPGPMQHHILIVENRSSAIHAHAGLRRVVRQPFDENIVFEAHWRLVN